jgi:Tfp pilus assembly protein PilO
MDIDLKKLRDLKIFSNWKTLVLTGLGVLLAADILLAVVIVKSSSVSPEQARIEHDNLQTQARLLDADVARAERIKTKLEDVGKKSDTFYKEELPSSEKGYSDVEIDLGSIAEKAGLKTSLLGFHQKEIKDRGVTEIQITAAVEGDYSSLLKFVDGIERSEKFYLLDGLTLASGSAGGEIKLNLTLRTFFRT